MENGFITSGPDQTPHLVAFDLGVHCLLMSLLWNTRHFGYYNCLPLNIYYREIRRHFLDG